MPSKTRTRNKCASPQAPSACGRAESEARIPTHEPSDPESFQHSVFFAVAEQNIEKLAECISQGHDLHNGTPVKGCTPLLLAVKLGNFEMVKLLVESGASCCTSDENGTTVLHHAAVNGLAKIATCLVDGGAAIDQQNLAGCTPFYQAVQHGHIDCVQTLLALRADLERRTRTGATPLYIASDRGNLELVNILLNANADANVVTEMQMTPLLVAAFNGHEDVVRSLLLHNVDIEQRGPCGGTALYVAAQEGRQNVVEFLLQQGSKVDTRCDGEGNLTPSLIAAMQGYVDLVRLLLKAKGDISVRTGKGSTLALMAGRHGRTNVLKMLVDMEGSKVLDDEDTEGVSVLGASKLGRHTETTDYIKKAMATQREADLNAWEASLPEILQELDPPSKKKTKAKSKHKGKAPARNSCKGTREAAVASPDILERCCHQEEMVAPDATNIHSDASDEVHHDGESVTDVCSEKLKEKYLAGGPWMQVKRKGSPKPDLSITPPESPVILSQGQPASVMPPAVSSSAPGPDLAVAPAESPAWSSQAEPAPIISPVVSAAASPPGPVKRRGSPKPDLAIAPPESPALSSQGQPPPIVSPVASSSAPVLVTPVSAQSTTPCGTTSPCGLSSVVPIWPSTPESWPHFEGGLGSTLWHLPPAVTPETMSLIVPEKACLVTFPGIHLQDASLPPLHSNSAFSVTNYCQSVFAAS